MSACLSSNCNGVPSPSQFITVNLQPAMDMAICFNSYLYTISHQYTIKIKNLQTCLKSRIKGAKLNNWSWLAFAKLRSDFPESRVLVRVY